MPIFENKPFVTNNINRKAKRKQWPSNSPWAEPVSPDALGSQWDIDQADMMELDDEGQELLEIKEYFDGLVASGRLNEDYTLNEDYEEDFDLNDENDEHNTDEYNEFTDEDYSLNDSSWQPEIGEDFWDDGFDVEGWEQALLEHINLLKVEISDEDPVSIVHDIIGYTFINENILRQAFTRRAFAIEYGLTGDSELLEFLGDSVLNTIVTREIVERFLETSIISTDAPFRPKDNRFDEGTLSKIRTQFVNKEFLSARAIELGLNKFILYGTGEVESESACEDMMEALLGAVAVDSNWNWETMASVVDKLLCIQLAYPDRLLKQSYFDIFNSWHQKKFGMMPKYEILGKVKHLSEEEYRCGIRFLVPDGDKGISRYLSVDADNRSKARELAAEIAYRTIVELGLWINLKDAHLVPDTENSINQLQELYQKKYVERPAEYTFEEWGKDQWECDCTCAGVHGYGRSDSKVKAKKKAAYMVLVKLMKSAGICDPEWERIMWTQVVEQ